MSASADAEPGYDSGVTTRCPICGGEVGVGSQTRPFCSARCRLVDLDHWLSGDYRIPGEHAPDHAGEPSPADDAISGGPEASVPAQGRPDRHA